MASRQPKSSPKPRGLKGELHTLLLEQLAHAPRQILGDLFARKLEDAGVAPHPELIAAMVEHAVSGRGDTFHWDDPTGEDRQVQLGFTDEDTARFEAALKELLERLPDLVADVTESMAKSTLRTVKANWTDQSIVETAYYDGFKANIEARWGGALTPLRMLQALCHEVGEEIAARNARSKVKQRHVLRAVLSRLHARSCQIVGEILALLEGGYADGAMARWRTLYEINVVATVLVDGGEPLARRYLEHDVVESKLAADEYARCHAALGFRPLSQRDRKTIDVAFAAMVAQYGVDFGKPYGWAAQSLGLKRVTFRNLEDKAQRSPMRSYYKMASYNVHADVKGITHRLSVPDGMDMMLAGASNVGLSEPGQNTAITIAQTTALLFHERLTRLEPILQMRMMTMLRDEAVTAFVKAERALAREERVAAKSSTPPSSKRQRT